MKPLVVCLGITALLSVALGQAMRDPPPCGPLEVVSAEQEQLPDSVDGLLAELADTGEPCWLEAQHRWNVFVAAAAADPAMLEQAGDALAEVAGACEEE
jgi:hypothetical protein